MMRMHKSMRIFSHYFFGLDTAIKQTTNIQSSNVACFFVFSWEKYWKSHLRESKWLKWKKYWVILENHDKTVKQWYYNYTMTVFVDYLGDNLR